MRMQEARGGATMQEIVGDRTRQYHRLAALIDLIGGRRFMGGMISVEVVAIRRRALVQDET